MTEMRIALAMIGARRHYAAPRLLHSAGLLEHFYTDICATQGWPRLLKMFPKHWYPKSIRRLIGRIPIGIPEEKITSFPGFGVSYAYRLARTRSLSERIAVYDWAGKRFNQLIKQRGLGNIDAVYTFNGAGLSLMELAKSRGWMTVMEQTIAPFRIENRIIQEEQARYPEWETPEIVSAYCIQEEAEWQSADLILCGSEYVKAGITECGGPHERCTVVPYGVDDRFSWVQRDPHNGPLHILTVGSVGLRKGAPYVLEAARHLQGRAIFRMVGSIGVSPIATVELRKYVELVGQVPRGELARQYQWADVFLLPSLHEGSAGVVYEALSCGLPVLCTPNTGSVVQNGVHGFIIPIRNAEVIREKIELLAKDIALRTEMSHHARQRAEEYTLTQYGRRLVHAIRAAG